MLSLTYDTDIEARPGHGGIGRAVNFIETVQIFAANLRGAVMFEGFTRFQRLYRLNDDKRVAGLRHDHEVECAKARGDYEEKRDWIFHDYSQELSEIDDEIRSIMSRYLMREADRLLIPTPSNSWKDEDENWEESRFTGRWMLRAKAIDELRTKVRTEQRAKYDGIRAWATLLVAGGSLIVAFIALVVKV